MSVSRAAGPGFTLIELLVAVAILAVLAALSYRGLTSLADAEVRVRAEMDRWASVAKFMEQVDRDLSLALDAPSVDADGGLLVLRRSEGDPATGDTAPRRVAFRLQGERLEYLSWAPEREAPRQPLVTLVLDNVASLEWRALDASGTWAPAAPARGAEAGRPRAIEARLALASGERIHRIFVSR